MYTIIFAAFILHQIKQISYLQYKIPTLMKLVLVYK